jgi:oxygen-independent coproporphyrinogen-3 oxidase
VAAEPFGVYIHVPFCAHKCDFCAFATYEGKDALMDRYVEACRTEIARARAAGDLPLATSVYVGGGTPSRLSASQLCALISAVDLSADAEVTVECHPEDVSGPVGSPACRSGSSRRSPTCWRRSTGAGPAKRCWRRPGWWGRPASDRGAST